VSKRPRRPLEEISFGLRIRREGRQQNFAVSCS